MNAPVVPCPTCDKAVRFHPDSPWRPFCSERCRLIDLGEWFGEEKRIPGDPTFVEDAAAFSADDPRDC